MTRMIDLDRELEKEAEAEAWHLARKNAARMIAVREMMLDPKRLEFARWLISTGRISDYA